MSPTMKQETYFQAAKAHTLDLQLDSFEASHFLSFSDNESGDTKRSSFLKSHLHITTPSQPASLHSSKSAVEETSSKGKKRKKCEREELYTFKTRSESDVMVDDGYKWHKYGRKTVKNSPHPRNYYKCADSQCCVKKRVQREADDKGVVITTYEGKHNHQSPSVVYFIQKPFVVLPHHASFVQSPPLFYTSSRQSEFTFMNTT